MRRKTLAAGFTMVASLAVALTLSGVASAAPDNKNTVPRDLVCPTLNVNTTISIVEGSNSQSVFLDGDNPSHAVLRRGVLDGIDTITIGSGGPPDGTTFTLTDNFSFGGPGIGYEGRIVQCDLELIDDEDFKLTAHNAAILEFLGGPDLTPFIGAAAHRHTTGTFHVELVVPG
jgi:hypothetical protein